jgi:spore coat protein U-like protein
MTATAVRATSMGRRGEGQTGRGRAVRPAPVRTTQTQWLAHRSSLFACAAACLFMAESGHAAVTCAASATGVAFGNYTPLQTTASTSTGTVVVNCFATGAAGTVTLLFDLSTGMSGSYSPRNMFSGTHPLSYNLYLNAAHTQIWGDGTGGTSTISTTLTVTPRRPAQARQTVYGMIPNGQDVAAGSYSDTIVVTVSY